MKHYSVLKDELIDSLNIKEDGIYVDATVGYAGDATKILKRIKRGYLFAFDQDPVAVEYSTNTLKNIGNNFKIFNANFVEMSELLKNVGLNPTRTGILEVCRAMGADIEIFSYIRMFR